jgi:hypothetical protein
MSIEDHLICNIEDKTYFYHDQWLKYRKAIDNISLIQPAISALSILLPCKDIVLNESDLQGVAWILETISDKIQAELNLTE